MSHVPVIAVDGPGGSGKGAVTTRLAAETGYHLLDSGVLYRLVGLVAKGAGVRLEPAPDEAGLSRIAGGLDIAFEPTGDPENPMTIRLADEDVTRAARTDQAGADASRVAAVPGVRAALLGLQRSFRRPPGLIADGRDMGTVVFPDADVRIYLDASVEARAERRYRQLQRKGMDVNLHALCESIRARDARDMNRDAAPLRPARGAVVIDSTELGIDEVMERVRAVLAARRG